MKRHAAMALLALLCLLQLTALLRAPAAHHPRRISVTLAPGESVQLSGRALALAHTTRIALRRAADGSWWLRTLRREHPLVLIRDEERSRSGVSALRAGQRLQIGPTLFIVDQANEDGLSMRGAGHRWHYDGARVRRDGAVQPACPDGAWTARWNGWAPGGATLPRPLALGGNLHCGNRIGIPYTEPGSASVQGTLLTTALPITVDGADPAAAELPLAGGDAIAIGRTRLAVHAATGSLSLTPARDVALYPDRNAAPGAPVAWEWSTRQHWHMPGLLGPALLLLACAAMLAARRHAGAIPAALLVAGVAALVLQRAAAPPGLGVSMLLGWAALWCFMGGRRPLGLAGMAATVLLALGLLVQLEMALGAGSTSWARHFQKSCALLAIGLGAGALLRLRPPVLPPRLQVEYALAALAGLALCALGLQAAGGDETGVFDLQPVEFAKLALAAVSAHCIAVALGAGPERDGAAMRLLRLAAPVLLLLALFGVALVKVDDYSPLLLLLLWCAASAIAWACAARRAGLAGVLLGACTIVLLGIGMLRGSDGALLAQSGFYADRFAVWLDPAAHPHTGQQMLLAGRAIAQGGWLGADGWLGLSSLGHAAGSVLAIPAVQDDFAPTFLIQRHGLAAALLAWLLQTAFLAGLLKTACAAYAGAARARDFRLAWLGRFQCLFLAGGAAFVAGHLLLSWGTNLAILPVMGQPMSFLSAGGSHLLLFLCPLLIVDALSQPAGRPAATTEHHRRADHAGLRTT